MGHAMRARSSLKDIGAGREATGDTITNGTVIAGNGTITGVTTTTATKKTVRFEDRFALRERANRGEYYSAVLPYRLLK